MVHVLYLREKIAAQLQPDISMLEMFDLIHVFLSFCTETIFAGDVHHIKVGSETNVHDNTLVHVAKTNVNGNVMPTFIGSRVIVGRF